MRRRSDIHTHTQEERIKVCVRKRPLFPKEAEKGDSDVLVTDNNMRLQVLEPKVKVDLTKYTEEHDFFFDEVLDETASNQQVYENININKKLFQ